jgi:hypothetical protein
VRGLLHGRERAAAACSCNHHCAWRRPSAGRRDVPPCGACGARGARGGGTARAGQARCDHYTHPLSQLLKINREQRIIKSTISDDEDKLNHVLKIPSSSLPLLVAGFSLLKYHESDTPKKDKVMLIEPAKTNIKLSTIARITVTQTISSYPR